MKTYALRRPLRQFNPIRPACFLVATVGGARRRFLLLGGARFISGSRERIREVVGQRPLLARWESDYRFATRFLTHEGAAVAVRLAPAGVLQVLDRSTIVAAIAATRSAVWFDQGSGRLVKGGSGGRVSEIPERRRVSQEEGNPGGNERHASARPPGVTQGELQLGEAMGNGAFSLGGFEDES